jgi:hypothetical protein
MNTEDQYIRQVLLQLLMGPSPFSRRAVANVLTDGRGYSRWYIDHGFITTTGTNEEDYEPCTWSVSQKGKDFIIKGESE